MNTPTEQAWLSHWIESVWHDVRFSLRSLRRAPAFTATVVLTLALCIGANTAIISVLYGLVLKPLPYPHPEQIVDVYNLRPKAGQMHLPVSAAQYLDYKANADLFEDFALWRGWMFNIGEDGGTARYVGMIITPEYFSVLGVQPLMGRFFTQDDAVPGKGGVAVLMQSYWENHFKADPAIVGKEVRLSGRVYTIVGVAPRKFEDLSVAPNLVVPMEFSPQQRNPQWRLANAGDMYARIKPGVAHSAALAQLSTLEQRFLATANPQTREFLTSGGHRMGIKQVRETQTDAIKSGLLMLQGGALLVLLLGCVNVASLMLARANTRQAEFAVRSALGAGRGVLARQPLVESALLAMAGAALGFALAWGSLRVINVYLNKIVFGIPPVKLDAGVLGLTLLTAFAVALLIGLLPMVRVWRAHSLQGGLQSGTRGASRGGGIRATSSVLVVLQVALAFMLLIGAGLLMRSFAKVMAINPGFDAKQVIHVRVAYDSSSGKDDAALQSLQKRLLEKMRQIPGVELASYTLGLPGFSDQTMSLPIKGRPAGNDSVAPTAVVFGVSPEYFATMGIRLIEGRIFTEADQVPKARMVAIVDRKFAERYFPGRSPVGEMFDVAGPKAKPEDLPIIVGVVEVARVKGLEAVDAPPYVYWSMNIMMTSNGLSIELRTKRSFEEMMPLIRAQVRAVDPTLPIYGEKTMQMQLDDAAANRRGILWLLGAFAGIALILSAVGIYGMLAYDVTQRTKEIGIRGAIGASREQIVGMILKQGLFKAGLGLVIGLAGALILSRFMEKLLYDVKPTDPVVFVGVGAVLLAVALLASWLPARRAAKVDPMVALRYE